ncbi:MAG TPA: FAD-dependent oxidoreductase [Syntrophomonadaceae bacterium]|nr:FAD-dependent oxidoreductase [Syntrophomonadaceae bacterium]
MDIKSEFQNKPSSYWLDSSKATRYRELGKDLQVDVAIIGGGIAGISSAYLLCKAGARVAVLEADRILQGTTGHTTAKITCQHALIYAKLKKEQGGELAKQYAEANEKGLHMIAQIAADNNIKCDFSWQPAYIYTSQEKYVKEIEDEVVAAQSLGIEADFVEAIKLPIIIEAGLKFPNQAQFHPLKFLQALAQEIVKNEGLIFENTEAVQIVDNQVVITRRGNRIKASEIIIASHYPFFDGGAMFFSRIYQDRTYILGLTTEEKFPDGYYISAEAPTRSLRSQPYGKNQELILIAGERHKSGQGGDTNTYYQNLLDFAHQTFKVKDLLHRWSTQDCMTLDGIPYIGNLTSRSPNIYVATGFGKWGMSTGMASAMIISDMILQGRSPYAEVFNPSRITPGAIKSFLIQNLDVAKNFVQGKAGSLPAEVDIEAGEAALIKADKDRIGVYKDEKGKVYMVDTTCTHLGCELNWNQAEKSWDCPCHGSRFSFTGEILAGPAVEPLKSLGEGKNRVEARILK